MNQLFQERLMDNRPLKDGFCRFSMAILTLESYVRTWP